MTTSVKDLDHSPDMVAYFARVAERMEQDHGLSHDVARHLIDRYFSIDVSPTERVFTMHIDPDVVASDLVAVHLASTERASGKIDRAATDDRARRG